MQALLETEIQAIPPEILQPFSEEDPERLAWLYHSGLSALLETPRDINRVFNRLTLSAPMLAGEVSFPELLALEVLAVKCPPIYERIHADPEFFVSPSKSEKPRPGEPPAEDSTDQLLRLIHERHRPHVKKVLHTLFPKASDSSGGESRRMRSLGRLAAPDRLYTVLALGTPPGELSISEVRSFISDKRIRSHFVANRLTPENVSRLFEHIDTFPDLEIDDPEDFVITIARICDSEHAAEHNKRNERSFSGLSLSRWAWISVENRLGKMDSAARHTVLWSVIVRDGGRELACDAVAECYRQHTPKGSADERGRKRQWLTANQNSEICEKWAKRALPLLFDSKLDPALVRPIYRAAKFVCEN